MHQLDPTLHDGHPDLRHVSVNFIPLPELEAMAVAQFNLRLSVRRGYGISWKPMTLESAKWRRDRVAVNFIRHRLTVYDELVAELSGRGEGQGAIKQLQRTVLAAIIGAYPELAYECQRQARLKGLGNVFSENGIDGIQ